MREKRYALYTVRLPLMIPHAVSGSDSFMKTILAMHHVLDNEILALIERDRHRTIREIG